MTWLGKILTVLVLILAVAGMWFTVTAYVARANWKKDRDDWKRLYEEARAARDAEYRTYQTEKEALERQRDGEKSKTDSLAAQVAQLQGANTKVVKQVEDLQKAFNASDATAANLQANNEALNKEVIETRKLNDKLALERIALNIAKETAEKERQAAQNEAKQAVADRLTAEGRLEAANTQLAELRASGGGGSAGPGVGPNTFKPAPAALPDGTRGTVTVYRDGLIQMSVGIDAGLTSGAVLDVYRSEGGGKYLGTVTVTTVYPKEAVGTFRPADPTRAVARLRADELPKAGDTVGKLGR